MKESTKKILIFVAVIAVLLLAFVIMPQIMDTSEHEPLSVSVSNPASEGDELVLLSTSASKPEQEVLSEQQTEIGQDTETEQETVDYKFRSKKLLNSHYEKHGIEMGFETAAEYEASASAVVNNPNALHKTEKEDGDDVYYIEETNEFVIVSKDGYIRTYFNPSNGIDYFNRQ